MPETPLTANDKIVLTYSVNGLDHKFERYCDWNGNLVTPTVARNGGGTAIDLQDAADSLGAALSQVLAVGDAQTAAWVLQSRSGSVWSDQIYGTSDIDADWTNPRIPASQITLVLRDASGAKVRVIILESAQPMPYHYSALGSNTGPLHTFSSRLWAVGYSFSSPLESGLNCWDWVKSRGNDFLAANAFVGVTGDFNDKIRRARGLT